MSTKGASNRYGHTRNGRIGKASSHINYAWARDFNKRTLLDHFERHGSQLNKPTKESYVANAIKFANTIDKKDCVSFVDKNGTTYKYNTKKNILVIVNKKGYVITYFKPTEGYKYYQKNKRSRKK